MIPTQLVGKSIGKYIKHSGIPDRDNLFGKFPLLLLFKPPNRELIPFYMVQFIIANIDQGISGTGKLKGAILKIQAANSHIHAIAYPGFFPVKHGYEPAVQFI